MLTTVEGTYRDGKIELTEKPEAIAEARVIVTFLTDDSIDLTARGISQEQAAELRARLSSFTEDWERPEMSAYDAL